MPPRPPAARGSLRVVAGEARGRRLASPPGTATRPTSDRVRQAVFNALDSLGAVRGSTVVDAFGGLGDSAGEGGHGFAGHQRVVSLVSSAARAVNGASAAGVNPPPKDRAIRSRSGIVAAATR